MRVGLLTRLLGYIGIASGAMMVLFPLPIVQIFWLGALGFVLLGRWPGGDLPAWATGEAVPWPTPERPPPRQRRGRPAPAARRNRRPRAVPRPRGASARSAPDARPRRIDDLRVVRLWVRRLDANRGDGNGDRRSDARAAAGGTARSGEVLAAGRLRGAGGRLGPGDLRAGRGLRGVLGRARRGAALGHQVGPGARLVEPAVRQVVRRRQAQRLLQLPRPPRRGRQRRPRRLPLAR